MNGNSTTIIHAEVCGRCKFSRVNPQIQAQQQPGAELFCCRYPPHVTSILAGRGPGGAPAFMNHSTFPSVGKHQEACGEYKQRITVIPEGEF